MKKIMLLLLVLLTVSLITNVNGEEDFTKAESLIKSRIACDDMTNDQLESIGDYYMEQMHPGESHELMDNMMGGEGSESLKQVHINMAKRLYCNENVYIGYGMMSSGSMINMMMGNYPANYDYSNYGYWNIFWILFFVAVIFLIVWIIHRFGIKNTASETPLYILRKRFAKGEITKKEFENMKKEMEE